MTIPFLDLHAQYARIREALEARVLEVLRSQRFIGGPEIEGLEAEVAAYCGARSGVGCSSGSDALILALRALDIGPGDEVITSPFTFFASASSIELVGARAVFADVEPGSFNLDPAAAEAAVTPRTRALIPVDLFGQAADHQAFTDLARRKGLAVIDDAAQSIGAEHRGRRLGSLGAAFTTLSFYPGKNLGACGDAGMVLSDDPARRERVARLRVHGEARRYVHDEIGYNARLDALQAAVLRVKLVHLDAWTAERQAHAAEYSERLGHDLLALPVVAPHATRHVWNQFVVRVREGRRDRVQERLAQAGVPSVIYYPRPLHLQACFAHLGGREGQLPVAEQACHEVLALPVFPELTPAQKDHIVASLRGALDAGA